MGRPKKIQEEKVEKKEEGLSKQDRFKLVMREINKKMGEDVIKSGDKIEARERIPTGVPEIDQMIGGGIVRGLTTTVWGSKGSSKTSLAYSTIASAQKLGLNCVYVDVECAFDPERAKLFGVDTNNNFWHVQCNTAEAVMDVLIKITRESVADLIVLDSVQGMSPHGEQFAGKAETEKSVADDTIALLARKMSQFFRIVIPYLSKAKCALLLIGQARMDLGSFIKMETLSGGHALAHNSRLIIKFRHGQGVDAPVKKIKNDEGKTENIKIGYALVAHVDKSQIGGCIEGSEINIPYYYTSGFNKPQEEK